MAKTKAEDRSPDLREFIKENDQRVYDFCTYLLDADFAVEDVVLSVFREFGEYFRRHRWLAAGISPEEMRLQLFQIAWAQIQDCLHQSSFPIIGGRDTRTLKGLDEDILPARGESRDRVAQRAENRVRDRLSRVDAELRAPVVLRDVLKFEDEEAARILGLRWGVYRHRLHRGRLDFKDALKGTPAAAVRGASANA